MSIEREQPSTAFKPMGVFAKLDGITGKSDPQGDLTLEALDSASLVQQDGQTYYKGPGGQLLGPLGGEGVFKPQDIDTKGSVIVGDNHFTPDRGGDSLTGDGRPMNVWTNGSATSFEDRLALDFDSNDAQFCNGIDPDIQRPTHPNDNIGTNSDSYFGDEIHFFTPVASQNGTATFAGSFNLEKGDLPMEGEIFQPAAGMNSFGESLNPVLEVGGTAGPGATSFMTGQFDVPMDNIAIEKM